MNIDDVVYGQDVIVQVVLSDDATGNVTVSVDGISNTVIVKDGSATVKISYLEAGLKEAMDEDFDGESVETLKMTGFGFDPENYFTVNEAGDLAVARDTSYQVKPELSFNLDSAVTDKVLNLQVKYKLP